MSSESPVAVESFRAEARDWLQNVAIPEPPTDLHGRFVVLQQWQKTLYEGGWMGIHWPAEWGGRGLTALHYLTFYEELARVGGPAPVGLIGLDVVGPSLLEFGSDDQRRRLIPPLLSGDEIWCQGFSEPEAGSDLASLATRAEVRGGELVITGQKTWTSWAHEASWCALLARTDPDASKHRGISYILVEMDRPGITVRPLVQITGDTEFSEVFFDQVRVPRQHVLGDLHDGWRIAMHTLSSERSIYALRRRIECEVAYRALLRTLDGQGDRLPERSLADLGWAYVGLRVLEAQTRFTLQRVMDGAGPAAVDSIDKLVLTETEQRLGRAVLDLLGPARAGGWETVYGLAPDAVIRAYLDSRAASIYGGTAQIQRNIVAERHLRLPRER